MCLFTASGYLLINLLGNVVLDVVKGDGDLDNNVLTLSGIAGEIGDDDDGEESLDLRGSLGPILLTLKKSKFYMHFA